MNIDRVIRMITRKIMNKGMNKGIQMASKRGKSDQDMTPEDRANAKSAQQNAKRARKAMRMGRRFMK